MSCFVVSNYHVSALVAWGARHGAIVGISPDALAHELAAANRRAYSERYAGRYDSELAPFAGLDHSAGQDLAAVAIVKACDCLAYQASDWSGWDGSEPSAHLAAIRARALGLARAGAVAWGGTGGRADQDGRDLAGYDDAAWELSEPAPAVPEPAAILDPQSLDFVHLIRDRAAARAQADELGAALVAILHAVTFDNGRAVVHLDYSAPELVRARQALAAGGAA